MVAVEGLPRPEAAQLLRVLVVESPGLTQGSIEGTGQHPGLAITWARNPFEALLMVGREEAEILLLPTDLDYLDLGQLVATVALSCQIPVLVAMTTGDDAGPIARRAVAAGSSGIIAVPFRESDVRLAIHNAARLNRGGRGDRILVAGLTIDLAGLTVTGQNGTKVQLSVRQFTCLYLLARAWPRTVRMDRLATDLGITGDDAHVKTRQLVTRLRQHIAPATGGSDLIRNIRGVGYRIRE